MLEDYLNPLIQLFASVYTILVVGIAITIMTIVHFKEVNSLKKHYWIPILIMYVTLTLFIVVSYLTQGTVAEYY